MAAQVITVRDAGSKAQLLELGVPSDQVRVTADPAFCLVPQPKPFSFTAKPVVCVVVRFWNFGVHPAFWEGEVAAGLDLFFERHGGEILFLPVQNLPGEAENDVEASPRASFLESVRAQGREMEDTRPPS